MFGCTLLNDWLETRKTDIGSDGKYTDDVILGIGQWKVLDEMWRIMRRVT
jgi:hypothetical protein